MRNFERFYKELVLYRIEHGDCTVPQDFVANDFRLGLYVRDVRSGVKKITPEQKNLLDDLGFVWRIYSISKSFDEIFNLLKEYNEKYNTWSIPASYIVNGVKLSNFAQSIRSGQRHLSAEQKRKLESIGFPWRLRHDISFEQIYKLMKDFVKENGHCRIPTFYKVANVSLGKIAYDIRKGKRRISDKERKMLNDIGFVWQVNRPRCSFEEVYNLLKEFTLINGHCKVPRDYVANGVRLGKIVNVIRIGGRKITEEQRELLNEIGFVWSVKKRSK